MRFKGEIGNHRDANAIYDHFSKTEHAVHGMCFDRGMADSYYRRPKRPHKWPDGTYNGEEVTDLTEDELEAYEAGYEYNEWNGDHKDWM